MQQCFLDYLDLFGLAPTRWECPRFYIQNNFVVSREQIRRYPLATWRRAYKSIVLQSCHRGAIERERVSAEAWALSGEGEVTLDFNTTILSSNELNSHMVFGGHTLAMAKWGPEQWCAQYHPREVCPSSPCTTTQPPRLPPRLPKDILALHRNCAETTAPPAAFCVASLVTAGST